MSAAKETKLNEMRLKEGKEAVREREKRINRAAKLNGLKNKSFTAILKVVSS